MIGSALLVLAGFGLIVILTISDNKDNRGQKSLIQKERRGNLMTNEQVIFYVIGKLAFYVAVAYVVVSFAEGVRNASTVLAHKARQIRLGKGDKD